MILTSTNLDINIKCVNDLHLVGVFHFIVLYFNILSDATTGATDDWSRDLAGVKYAFNPELRGDGFVTEDYEIDLSFQEVWNGLVAMTKEIKAVHGLSGNK